VDYIVLRMDYNVPGLMWLRKKPPKPPDHHTAPEFVSAEKRLPACGKNSHAVRGGALTELDDNPITDDALEPIAEDAHSLVPIPCLKPDFQHQIGEA
jgi:hypothetical protein